MFSSNTTGRGVWGNLSSPKVRVVAGTVVAALAVSSFAFTGTSAGATTLPNSQSVGRFVDGSLGGSPIQSIANVEDARAVNPGSVSDQNPLNVKLFNALDLPLTGDLQLPTLLGINLGAANQVAVAKSDGYSYGASGLVSNSGGVSVGGKANAYPADATINLTGSGIAGSAGAAADALGGVQVTLGAVSALAATPIGVDAGSTTKYSIGDVDIKAGSPLLGSILKPVTGVLGTLIGALAKAAGTAGLPSSCALSSATLPTLSLEGGAITLDPSTATLTISLTKLLAELGLNINQLPANTDLISYLLNFITSPSGLAKAVEDAINGLVDPLEKEFASCLNAIPVGGPLLGGLITALTGGKTTLENAVNGLLATLTTSVGANPLAPLAKVLESLVDIGINVQPNGPKGDYTDALKATPAQDTPVVPGQTVVRAIEVNVLGKSAINLALANAAAGPSNPVTAVTSPPATTTPPATTIPTGVPAGLGVKGGTPTAPIILLLLGLLTAGGGLMSQRLRGRRSH
jgi:hypothetical protein